MRSNCWSASDTAGKPNVQTRLITQARYCGANAQKKKLTSRQKIDKQIPGSKIVNDNNYGLYYRNNTSTATAGTPRH